jgi:hypothetical protein
MSETVKMCAVHPLGGNGRGKPECFITYETAREMVDAGQAKWSKNYKHIIRTKLRAEMHKPAPSLSPNIRVMDQYIEGKPHAVAIIDAYKHRYAA